MKLSEGRAFWLMCLIPDELFANSAPASNTPVSPHYDDGCFVCILDFPF